MAVALAGARLYDRSQERGGANRRVQIPVNGRLEMAADHETGDAVRETREDARKRKRKRNLQWAFWGYAAGVLIGYGITSLWMG
jgi:hypothetical protein